MPHITASGTSNYEAPAAIDQKKEPATFGLSRKTAEAVNKGARARSVPTRNSQLTVQGHHLGDLSSGQCERSEEPSLISTQRRLFS
jgi:hypothetical protein